MGEWVVGVVGVPTCWSAVGSDEMVAAMALSEMIDCGRDVGTALMTARKVWLWRVREN